MVLMGFSDSQPLRSLIAGACMLLAPLLFLAASVISPKLETSAGKQLAVAHSHLDRFYMSNLFGMIGLFLLVPAVLGLMHMVRERQPGYGGIGGGLAVIGGPAAPRGCGAGLCLPPMGRGGGPAAGRGARHRKVHTA